MDLSKLYNDPKFPGSFGGKLRFYKEAKKVYPNVKLKDINKALKSEDSYVLHRPVRRPKHYRKVYTKGINYLWQADLLDLQKYYRKNSGYRYCCFVIDCFSKKLWSVALKRKTAVQLTKALTILLTSYRPTKLQVDNGTEFYNYKFRDLLSALNIQLYSTYSDKKASIVERVQRTIRARLFKVFTDKKSTRWVDVMPQLVDSYNCSVHSTIKMKPIDVKPEHTKVILDRLYNSKKLKNTIKREKFRKPLLKLGNLVRIIKIRKTFGKEADQKWTDEIFRIRKVQRYNFPVTYLLSDTSGEHIEGSFYFQELQRV